MNKKYLRRVKKLIKSAWKFKYCRVKVYIEPSISSVVFFINVDGYRHLFKAPFGLIESNLCAESLAYIIVDEVLEWRKKYEIKSFD